MVRLIIFSRRAALRTAILAAALLLLLISVPVVTAVVGSAKPDTSVTLPVIMYHGLHPQRSRQNRYVIAPERFAADLDWLRENGYTTVTVADVIDYVHKRRALPEKPIMLTFDDGYLNNHVYGTPLLKEAGCRAVFSPICAETVRYSSLPDRDPAYAQVRWDDLRDMVASGCWEIQNHTYAMHTLHPRRGSARRADETASAYKTALTEDVERAQALFLQELGFSPTAFFYPFGAIGEGEPELLREMGFQALFTCTEQKNQLTEDPECLYALGRFLRPPDQSSAQFFTKTVGLA